MKKLSLLLAVVSMFYLAGCVSQVSPVISNSQINDIDFSESKSWKSAEACRLQILVFPPFGNGGIDEAANKASISKVKVVDYKVEDYIFFQRFCTIVYGK
ncbi:MAG: hypothetical protein JJE30_09625 [Desulfuromonadales bacterium]|nr:hypothetical protein [Desulfuromonadales bacterium]